jgi:hypothetical protein
MTYMLSGRWHTHWRNQCCRQYGPVTIRQGRKGGGGGGEGREGGGGRGGGGGGGGVLGTEGRGETPPPPPNQWYTIWVYLRTINQ